jgi:hypothetical protein
LGHFVFFVRLPQKERKKYFSQRRHDATFEIIRLFFAPRRRCERIISFETVSFNLYCFQTDPHMTDAVINLNMQTVIGASIKPANNRRGHFWFVQYARVID